MTERVESWMNSMLWTSEVTTREARVVTQAVKDGLRRLKNSWKVPEEEDADVSPVCSSEVICCIYEGHVRFFENGGDGSCLRTARLGPKDLLMMETWWHRGGGKTWPRRSACDPEDRWSNFNDRLSNFKMMGWEWAGLCCFVRV